MTLQIYTHRSAGRDQAMAQTLGEMIQAAIGSGLAPGSSPGPQGPTGDNPSGPPVEQPD
ncbi:MAG TPA: hypothetical protein VF165_00150 [Nocardioidaceae bacterium]